ncbi:MAG: DUF2946 domain-containing protein [Proteobacteria bacterium]|nr:DUF2946 domain-containing protein [Pseudomonadota bacterium]
MTPTRRQRRGQAWLGLALAFWLTFAPTISHAVQLLQGRYAPWQELCSALYGASVGQTTADAGADHDGGTATHAALAVFHCPYCALDAHGLALPATVPAVLPLQVSGREMRPRLAWVGPRTLHAWVTAQPRAPPVA